MTTQISELEKNWKQNVLENKGEKMVLYGTDPQPGGKKLGEANWIMKSYEQLFTLKYNNIPIIFEEFEGDVIGNWGKPGAAKSWKAYSSGVANLYVDHKSFQIENVIFAGMIKGNDLQERVEELTSEKRQISQNIELCNLTETYGERVISILKETVKRCETTLFYGGGDRGIYPAGKAIKLVSPRSKLILLRVDRHMDERFTSLRSDPAHNTQVYPHSGNGVAQLKNEDLVFGDFLLGVDYARNNGQCINGSLNAAKNGVKTEMISIDELQISEKFYIDQYISKIASLQYDYPEAEVLVNIDADTFNRVPSSAMTNFCGIDAKWAFYLLSQLNKLSRPPRTIRIAELAYPDDSAGQAAATEFASQCLRASISSLTKPS